LACAAFIIDRACDSGPDQAAAANAPAGKKTSKAPGRSPASPGPRNTAPPSTEPDDPAVKALARLPDLPEARDLFATADFTAQQQAFAGNAADDAPADPAVEFAVSHSLQATLQDGSDRVALVDGRILRPGQTLDGFRLLRVDPYRAIFRFRDVETPLLLKTDTKGPEKAGSPKSPKKTSGSR